MGPIDALWHLAGFLSPAIGIGVLSAVMAKLVWRRELKPKAWLGLAMWPAFSAALMSVGGLLVFGRDGLMSTYAAMVLAAALTLWRVGFASPRR